MLISICIGETECSHEVEGPKFICAKVESSMLASNGLWDPATEEFGSDLEATSPAVSRHSPRQHR